MMKPQSFHLINEQIRANALAYVSQLECGKGWLVQVKSEKDVRSATQSRLRWLWFTQMEKELAGVERGRTKIQWNLYFKSKYMKTLLIEQDEDWVQFFHDYEDTCESLSGCLPLKKNYQQQFWSDIAKTEEMTIKTFSRWLDTIDKYVLNKYGLQLVIPDDLIWVQGK